MQKPKKEEKEKFYCCCCCESGPMTLVLCIPYTGFVPGQIIPLTIELDNNSNVAIEEVKIKLERVSRKFFLNISMFFVYKWILLFCLLGIII